MKYDRLSRDEINKALITIAETMETERQSIKRIADGSVPLPKNQVARDQLADSHTRIVDNLAKDYEDLLKALAQKY